ncbi:hypothetical protein V2J09_008704 [Rumex salicifolius]
MLKSLSEILVVCEGGGCPAIMGIDLSSYGGKSSQTDMMRFLLRVRCWEYRQLPSIVRVTHSTRPDKARRLGYNAKQGELDMQPGQQTQGAALLMSAGKKYRGLPATKARPSRKRNTILSFRRYRYKAPIASHPKEILLSSDYIKGLSSFNSLSKIKCI